MNMIGELSTAYRLRWQQRRLLWRAFRARHALTAIADRTKEIGTPDILCFVAVRNEAAILPWFLSHHRRLGVDHFLFVDNGSNDGTSELLSAQPDVSLWRTGAGYRAARFGMDWIGWLMLRHGNGHWCLVADADESLVYPDWESRGLRQLTAWLDRNARPALPAIMVDLYPKGPIGDGCYRPGDDPFDRLSWFDPDGYSSRRHPRHGTEWIQGGPRARVFHAANPSRAPTLNKIPLVKWHWRYAWVNAAHALLPRRLNAAHRDPDLPRAALLHAKFLPQAVTRATEEKARREHFGDPDAFDGYYDALAADPILWHEGASRYRDWRDLAAAGLIWRGAWV